MAVKNHALDQRIVEAAKAEFMERGFRDASVRNIARRAGLSTGAIYTRYENKDVLFRSLVKTPLQEMGEAFAPMKEQYLRALEAGTPERMLEAVKQEEQLCQRILLKYYEECILFFCRSEGSSIARSLKTMMDEKARQTVDCFHRMGTENMDFDGIHLILSEQFQYFRRVLEMGYSREKAISCMNTVAAFLEAGWNEMFRQMTQSRKD